MTQRSFIIFSFITIVFVIAAIISVANRPVSTLIASDRALVFPGVDEKLNQIASFEIQSAKRKYTVKRIQSGWGIAELSDYKVNFDKVKTVLIQLSQLKFLEAKTSDPARYERLDLRKVTEKESKSNRIIVRLKDNKVLASGLIGKRNEDLFGSGKGGTYIRVGNDKQSWLVEGIVELGKGPVDWVDKTILDIPRASVKRILIKSPTGGLVKISRLIASQKDFKLANIPKGKNQRGQWETNEMAKVLEKLELLDLDRKMNLKFSSNKIYKATIHMFGGLLIHAEALKRNKKEYWAQFSAAVDESTVVNAQKTKETVENFNLRHNNFWYAINETTGKKLACDHINLLEGAGIKACA